MPDAKQRNEHIATKVKSETVDICHYCCLSDFLSGVMRTTGKRIRDHRFNQLARVIMNDGYSPDVRCMYGNKGALLVVQVEGKEYRQKGGKIYVSNMEHEE